MQQSPLGPLLERLGHRLLRPRSRRESDAAADGSHQHLRSDGGQSEDAHLADLPDGAGCTEIWEHLSGSEPTEAIADD